VPITATPLTDVSPIIAGVNSFGFGGTNAHVILSTPPTTEIFERSGMDVKKAFFVLILSARSLEALNELAKAYEDFFYKLPGEDQLTLNDICYTAAVRRSHLPFRLTIVGKNSDGLRQQLTTYIQDEKGVGVVYGRVVNKRNLPVVFLFTGQGSQWWGMARELLVSESVFRGVIESCDKTLQKLAGWSLLKELAKDEDNSKMTETAYAQPALLAIQAGLIALWRSWGVIPDAVVGHSVGEIAAAYAAGIINLEAAVGIAFHRGRLMDRASVHGKMLAVAASIETMMPYLSHYEGRIALAAINSPLSLTLSGDSLALAEMVDELKQDKIGNKYLNVNYAFHSALMEPLQDELLIALRDFLPRKATVKIISTVTGQASLGSEWDATYWWKNLRQTVQFGPAVDELIQQGYRTFLEVGPHPVLAGSIKDCLRHCNMEGTVLGSLQKGKSDQESLYNGLGALHTLGVEINWRGVYPITGQLVSLPSYTWQRERCWSEDEKRVRDRFVKSDHPLLGTRQLSACPTWSGFLSQRSTPYLSEHSFQGVPVFPAAGYLEMALAAGYQIHGSDVLELEDVVFENACFLPENNKIPLEFRYTPEEARFEIYSRNKSGSVWTRHATGRVLPSSRSAAIMTDAPEMIMDRLSETVSSESLYETFVTVGLDYGPSFRGIVSTWRNDFEALGDIQSVSGFELETNEYLAHPDFLDACFQVVLAALPIDKTADSHACAYLPVSVERLRLFRRLDVRAFSHVTLRACSKEALIADLHVVDAQGIIMLEVKGLRCQAMAGNSTSLSDIDDLLYTSRWMPQPLSEAASIPVSTGTWLIFANSGNLGKNIKEKLIAQGQQVVIARIGNHFMQEANGDYLVEPVSIENFTQLFHSINKDGSFYLAGIAYLWGLDCKVMSQTTLQSLEKDESTSSIPLIYLIQALALERVINCRLWIVTQYAQSTAQQEQAILSAGQAALWGIRRVAAYEHVSFQPSIIDIGNFKIDTEALVEELLANSI
jgi:acyl transferase domain-containing protein